MDHQELLLQVTEMMRQQSGALSQMMQEHTKEIKLMIEHDVAKRIDALFDGYKLTHEKQWEQERMIEALQAEMEKIQLRLLTLENKIA